MDTPSPRRGATSPTRDIESELSARILDISVNDTQGMSEKGAVRRLLRVMNTREELDSAAPSVLLWAIVSTLLTGAFLVLGVVRNDFLWAGVAAVTAGVFWWRFRTERRGRSR